MAWNASVPVGSSSVKVNRPLISANFSYIQTTMGNTAVGTNTSTTRDHFWNVGGNEDGRHRFIKSVGFTSTAVAPNNIYPVLGAGMQTVLFPLLTNSSVQWFHKNSSNNNLIYQVTPNFIKGTISGLTSSFVNLVDVPANVYGEIIMWRTTTGKNNAQTGFFRSTGTVVETWALYLAPEGSSETINLKFANGSDASDLNIRARTSAASSGTDWEFRITYRAI